MGVILTPTVDPPGQGARGTPGERPYGWGGDVQLADFAAPPDTKPTLQGLRLREGAWAGQKASYVRHSGCPHVSFPHLSMRQSRARLKTILPPSTATVGGLCGVEPLLSSISVNLKTNPLHVKNVT